MNLERLYQNFDVLENWEDRYKLIIDLGKKLPSFPEDQKTEENRVRGCMSQVWLIPKKQEKQSDSFKFVADSDAMIVRGLIAILQMVFNNKSAQEILKIDIKDIFKKLGLEKHLSPGRSNGFFSMVEKIKLLSIQSLSKAS